MKITKKFDLSLSHRFPSGDIATVKLGTIIELDAILDSTDDTVITKLHKSLAKQARKATQRDWKTVRAADPLAREVYQGLQDSMKNAEDEREAERILEEED